MKNLLVTGGSGFIGSNLVRFLLTETDFAGRLINLDSLTYAANPLSLSDVSSAFADRYQFVRADICNREELEKVFDQFDIDAVCHLAAESHVDRSIVRPDQFIQTNIIGTFNLLDICRTRKERIRLFHHVSTDEVFGSLGATGLFTEETPYRPNSPYSASKASSDHLVRAYGATYGLPVTISNCSNNYGPYQFPEKLIPLMILNALERKPLPVYGDGLNVRDWLYVIDHCRAIWQVMTRGVRGETYNVGGRNEMANIDVVKIIADLVDKHAVAAVNKHPTPSADCACTTEAERRRDLITFVTDRPGHDRRYAIDCAKIEAELGWKPQETFASGIEKTVLWYLSNSEWIRQVQSGDYQNWIQENYSNR